MSKHIDFILTPMADVIREARTALPPYNGGIETRAICEYILQSLFLKLTGFQEQKMKCIAWELATDNFEYRRGKFKNVSSSECSAIEDKQHIIYEMVRQCRLVVPLFEGLSDTQLQEIIDTSKEDITGLFTCSILESWDQRHIDDFNTFLSHFSTTNIVGANDAIFSSITKEVKELKSSVFNFVYRQRNRCAHNTLSYQQNLPDLKQLSSQKFSHDNYCILIFILLVLDKVVVSLYQKYREIYAEYEF